MNSLALKTYGSLHRILCHAWPAIEHPIPLALPILLTPLMLAALMELRGQLLMGESSDVDSNEARVSVANLQSKLETYADVMGMVPRQTAVKALLSLNGAGNALPEELEQEELIQMEAKAVSGWGRRRRGATWEKSEPAKAAPAEKKPAAAKPVPIVKKEAKKPIVEPTGSPKVDEAKTKAAKAR